MTSQARLPAAEPAPDLPADAAPPAPTAGAPPRRRAAILWLLLATAIWGGSFPLTQAATLAMGGHLEALAPGAGARAPIAFLLVRFSLATVLAALLPGALGAFRRSPRATLRDTLLVGVPFVLGFLLQYHGLVGTSATLAAFLTSTYVLFVPIVLFALGRGAPRVGVLAGALLGALGTALLAGATSRPEGIGAAATAGPRTRFGMPEVLVLASAATFGAQVVAIDGASRRTRAAALTFGTMALTAATMALLLGLLPGGGPAADPRFLRACLTDTQVVVGTLYSAVLSSVVATQIIYACQPAVDPGRAAIIYALEPAFAAAFAAWSGQEALGLSAVVGCCLIILGNGLADLRRNVS